MSQWLDDLLEVVESKISAVSSFKTHKLKKAFFGDLKNTIRTAVLLNTQSKEDGPKELRNRDSFITVPVPGKQSSHSTVRTQGDSERADAHREATPKSPSERQVENFSIKPLGQK